MPSPNSAAATAALNTQLTSYAQGLWNDLSDVVKMAERLAPTVQAPTSNGQYKAFDDKNSFKPESTARTLGGDPTVISFSASDAFYNCKPQALETRVDKEEDNQAGAQLDVLAAELLDQGKIKALINKTALSHVLDVGNYVMANTAAVANRGNFSSADVDPIDQLDEQLEAISLAVGSVQNIKLTMDVSSWRTIRNHPKVKARTSGVQVGGVTQSQLNELLMFPVDFMVGNIVYDSAALAQAANKKRVLAGSIFIHYSVPNPTPYDPSAFKCFTVGPGSYVAGVRTYQAPNGLYRGHLMDWSRDIKKTSALSVVRIDLS